MSNMFPTDFDREDEARVDPRQAAILEARQRASQQTKLRKILTLIGVICVAVGGVSMLGTDSPDLSSMSNGEFFRYYATNWPTIVLVVGLVLVVIGVSRRRVH